MALTNGTWVSCTFSQSGLDGSSDLVKEDHPELSFVQCIVLAMALDWVYLVILGATRGCTLYEINAYAVGAVTRDPVGGDTRCKTPDRVVGCPKDNQFHPVGYVSEEKSLCGEITLVNTCNDEGIFDWQGSSQSETQSTSCTSPFVQEPAVGCVYVKAGCWVDVPLNEAVCRQFGAKMASPKTVSDFMALSDYLETFGIQFIAGAEYSTTQGKWVWKYHGREIDPSEWDVTATNTDGYLQFASWTNYKLRQRSSGQGNLLCMADV